MENEKIKRLKAERKRLQNEIRKERYKSDKAYREERKRMAREYYYQQQKKGTKLLTPQEREDVLCLLQSMRN